MDHVCRATHLSARFATVFLISVWLAVQQASGQSYESAFGVVRAFPLPDSFERISLLSSSGGNTRLLLWSPRSRRVAVAEFSAPSSSFTFTSHVLPLPVDGVTQAGVMGGIPHHLLLHSSEQRISLLAELSPDSLRVVAVLDVPVEPRKASVADITNDRHSDILVYDPSTPGIIPYLGMSAGNFRQGGTIAPDNAVADLAVVALNNDLLLDLVLLDWVDNKIHFLYGVGRGEFLSLNAIPVAGEGKALRAGRLHRHGVLDLFILSAQPPQMEVWEGNTYGEFRTQMVIPLREIPIAYHITDVNGNGWSDLVTLDRGGVLRVGLLDSEEGRPTWLEFFAGRNPQSLILHDLDQDGAIDAAVLDAQRKELILFLNSAARIALVDSLDFATGLRPRGLWIGDANGNGKNEIVVANEGSGAISVFSVREDSTVNGQVMYSVPEGPRQIAFHSATDSTVAYVLSHPQSRSVSYFVMSRPENITVSAEIPDVGEMETLYAALTPEGLAEFFCFNASTSPRTPALTHFQQLGPRTFIERTFRLTIPDALLGAAVGDVNGDGFVDVVYAYRNRLMGRDELAVSLGDAAMSFDRRVFSYSLPAGMSQRCYLWLTDLDGDGRLDLVFSFPQNLKLIAVAKGNGDGTFQPFENVAHNVSLADRAQLEIDDVDGDGIPDLLVNNANAIEWYRGKGDGSFEPRRLLAAPGRIGHFAVGDITGDGHKELVVSLPDAGRLRLYAGSMLWKETRVEADH